MKDEKTISFYKRREFKYLTIACTALIVTAVGAIFYNKHPRPVKNQNPAVIQNDTVPAGSGNLSIKTDSINYQPNDSVYIDSLPVK